ncbi:hypothetical protein SMD20_44275 [Nonomuraea sp. LP-02]|uniref:hypothetical protein n=1 Tax=Nonomuraea sp. LP-02 TaxID=3097960 RepID=UPI002E2EC54C|nr:hypothetical protein [Nonomuraea sp. LP-02]MED7931302.1 hypothetical protein [Nonomuraea sp. LP-02]
MAPAEKNGKRGVLALTSGGFATKALVTDPVEIPEDLPAGAALALLVQGLTAWHLLRTAARIVPGETVVVYAAAGGVGHLAILDAVGGPVFEAAPHALPPSAA